MWARGNTPATANGGTVASWAIDLTAPLTLDRLSINAADNTSPQGLSIGLLAFANSNTLDLVTCLVSGGNVTPGQPGANGINGVAGGLGGPPDFVEGFAVVIVNEAKCLGPKDLDFNCDGYVDGLDVQIFVDRLLE